VLMLESGEMYLETIYILSKKQPAVRSVDIAAEMAFSKPAISRAVGKLKQDAYLIVQPDGSILLTEKGAALAEKIYERHTVLTEFLVKIGVGREIAVQDACKLEHAISDESFAALKRYVNSK